MLSYCYIYLLDLKTYSGEVFYFNSIPNISFVLWIMLAYCRSAHHVRSLYFCPCEMYLHMRRVLQCEHVSECPVHSCLRRI